MYCPRHIPDGHPTRVDIGPAAGRRVLGGRRYASPGRQHRGHVGLAYQRLPHPRFRVDLPQPSARVRHGHVEITLVAGPDWGVPPHGVERGEVHDVGGAAAVRVGKTRLLDNVILEGDKP